MSDQLHHITAGFLPLLDSAVLVAAERKGFAETENIRLNLIRETSWANIRDRVAVGHFDVAHMLAPMPIASSLNLSPLSLPLIAPMALGLGGNAVTVSNDLWARLADAGAPARLEASGVGAALRAVVRAGGKKLRFGVVHPFSGHNYELRYWLAGSGIHPDQDVELIVVPPPLMPDALAAGTIDGYCVGEPWNSAAAVAGTGRIVTVKAAIWRSSPEKVLGVTERWAQANAEALAALLRALYRSAQWCGDPTNHEELAGLLAGPEFLDRDPALLLHGLSGQLQLERGVSQTVPDFFVPAARAATFPWVSHALWFYSQMVRWGQVVHSPEQARVAARCYRPDLYRAAIAPLGEPLPGASSKVEGALVEPTPVGVSSGQLTLGPDGFFDGAIFDPDQLDAYISAQSADDMPKK